MQEVDEPVHVAEYRASWPAAFAKEHARLVAALNLPPQDLQHIGSTAVPGLIAKPIIDIMLGVVSYPPPELLIRSIVSLGYVALGEAGVPGRLYFRLRGPACFNLHLVGKGSGHWTHNLALRDYLRIDAGARKRYELAKRSALAAGARTLLAYSAVKSAVLEGLLQEALARQNGIR